MNQRRVVFLYLALLLTQPIITLTSEEPQSQNGFSLMALLQSPIHFVTGCRSVAESLDTVSDSCEHGSARLSESLEITGKNIQEAGTNIQESGQHVRDGLVSASQDIEKAGKHIKDAAEGLSVITHTWDPDSRPISNTAVQEIAIGALGLAVSLTGLYFIYQGITYLLLPQPTSSSDDHKNTNNKSSFTEIIRQAIQQHGKSTVITVIGLAHFLGGLYMIKHNSYIARALP